MKTENYKYLLFLSLLLTIGISSCKYYINHHFRQSYTDLDQVISRDTSGIPFFKVHLKNGEVSVLDHWHLNPTKDSLSGNGRLYDFNRHQIFEGNLTFSIENVAIIETNQLTAIKSKDNGRIAALGVLTGANLVMGAYCLTNPKACFGSCPTFYIEGEDYLHAASAEGFSSAISPALEQSDLDALNHRTSAQRFSITMKNEAFETHMVNELAILGVLKKKGEGVYHGIDGNYYRCGPLMSFSKGRVNKQEIGSTLKNLDEMEYFSLTDSFDLTAKETIILEFDQLTDHTDLGVLVNFRQTLLTTFLLYSGLSFMGDEVCDYFAKIETNEKMRKRLGNPFEKLGGIKLYVWDSRYKNWNLINELFETGPIAKNLMLTPILGIKPESGKLKVKLELTKGLWRLDYVGLAPIHDRVQPVVNYPIDLKIISGQNYSIQEVNKDDEKYLISFPGDEYQFDFSFDALPDDQEYELFLLTKGYYLEWIRPAWIKGKNISKLSGMLMHDKQTWRELAQEFKTMESDMESIFWNSKYAKTQ